LCGNPEEVYWSFSGSLWAVAVAMLLQKVDLSLDVSGKGIFNEKKSIWDCTKYTHVKPRKAFPF
jgi:hypothetical protein